MLRTLFAGLLSAGFVMAVGWNGIAQDTKLKAAPKKEKPVKFSINDPAKLKDDADFAVQGEYEGETSIGGKPTKIGLHVIAQGNGKFLTRSYLEGLPGAGWVPTPREKEAIEFGSATRDGGMVTLFEGTPAKPVGEIINGQATWKLDRARIEFKKAARSSPTLGEKPPPGALVLFNGPADLDKWENGQIAELSDGKYLAASGTRTKEKFQSFKLHIEFRTPWMPTSTGQQRGNSGVYLQDRYEVQVLDSFGLKGVDNECGGIYKEAGPKVNMCFPPMTWQTYDIDFTAAEFDSAGKKTKPAKVTIKHNGVVIQDGLELKSNTPGGKIGKEIPEPGSLFLQNHGDPVVFNNIWLVKQ